MSLRIITKPDQIAKWIADRDGVPIRTECGLEISFVSSAAGLTVDELLDEMKFKHMVMLVDQEPGKTFHRIYAHS